MSDEKLTPQEAAELIEISREGLEKAAETWADNAGKTWGEVKGTQPYERDLWTAVQTLRNARKLKP